MLIFPKKYGSTHKSLTKGFTLVELLVTITIFVFITALVLTNYQSFNSTVILNSLAYNIALSIREAQSYGINVTRNTFVTTTGSGSPEFDHPYGIHFATNIPDQFILFVDVNDDNTFQSTEQIKMMKMKNGNRLQPNGGRGTGLCAGNDKSSCMNVSVLDILFKRPSPAAIITPSQSFYGRITVRAKDNNTKAIVVRRTGQISVED